MRVRFPPIKNIYLPHHVVIHNCRHRYILLYGGRGGGKSTDAAKKLIIRCLTEPYFKFILLRKTYVSIKDSQFSAIMSIVNEWGLSKFFRFLKSPLEIRCMNGNSFIARGLDKEDTTKSVDNPTGIWYEEANQMTEGDFISSTTSVRTLKATYLQEILTFNPECDGDYVDFWLFKRFFQGKNEKSFVGETVVNINGKDYSFKHTVIHSNMYGNPYLPPEYIAQLESLKDIDPYYYNVYTLGLWGNKKNDSPFIFAYSPDKHNGRPVRKNDEIFYLSFDFNKNPITCSVIQHYGGVIRVIETIKLNNSSIYELCEYIKVHYMGCIFIVTGDATGSNRTAMVRGNAHYYSVIMKELNLSVNQIRVPKVNPPIEKNGLLVNAVLANYLVEIHVDKAASLIFDMKNVRRRADGTIEKGDRNNPAQQADALDTFRYWCNMFMNHIISV